MGQQRDSKRNASLDERKSRAAGRQDQQGPGKRAIQDAQGTAPAKGKAAGAFGKEGKANKSGGAYSRGGGGGGGANSRAKDAPVNTPASRKTNK